MAEIGMEYDEFYERYKPTDNYFDSWEDARDSVGGDINRVWTVRDSEGPYTCLTNGVGWVNRLEYTTTELPWEMGESIYVGHG